MGKAVAGIKSVLSLQDTLTAASGLAAELISAPLKLYRVTDRTKCVLEATESYTIYDNGVAVAAANIEKIFFLTGYVYFKSTYTVVGPITIDASYWTLKQILTARSYSRSITKSTYDSSTYAAVQANNYERTRIGDGILNATASIENVYDAEDEFIALVQAGTSFILIAKADGEHIDLACQVVVSTDSITSNFDDILQSTVECESTGEIAKEF